MPALAMICPDLDRNQRFGLDSVRQFLCHTGLVQWRRWFQSLPKHMACKERLPHMQTPLEIVYEGMDPSDSVDDRLREEVDKLEQFFGRITSCRVVVEKPHRHNQKGNLYTVRLHLTLPGGGEVAVSRHPGEHHAHEDVYVAIRDAFKAARRQLQDTARKNQGKVKSHEAVPHGQVTKLLSYEGYGFITTSDGREIYFHRNSVAGDAFDKLEIGDAVRFAEDMGEKGPQASHVQPIGKHHPD